MIVSGTIIDEGASMSILSSTAWKVLGSPPLVPVSQSILGFNRGTGQPLGILSCLLRWEDFFYLNVIVLLGPLDYNILLGHDYVSTLF